MFKFLSHKLLNKKWLNACLLLGIILLVAVASCNPMFKNGALDMWNYYMEIDALQKQTSLSLQAGYTQSNLNHRTSFNMTYMPQIEDHVNITYGTSLEDAKTEDGVYPCIISQRNLDKYGLVERYSA